MKREDIKYIIESVMFCIWGADKYKRVKLYNK